MKILGKKTAVLLTLSTVTLSALALAGCSVNETSYTTFPKDYILAGSDVGNMTVEEAKTAISDSFESYALDLTINGYDFKVSATELGVQLNDDFDFDSLLEEANEDETPDTTDMILCADESTMESVIKNYLSTAISDTAFAESTDAQSDSEQTDAQKALSYVEANNLPYISYDSDSQSFVAVDGSDCDAYDFTDAISAIKTAIEAGDTVVSTEAPVVTKAGVKVADDASIEDDLATANEYLDTQISIKFELKGYKTNTKELSKENIAGFLSVQNDGRTIAIAEDALSQFCTDTAEAHNKSKWKSKNFQTTENGVIQITVPVDGVEVDSNQLYTDIAQAIEDKTSTTVTAVYNEVEATSDDTVDFDGNYVELDLTKQHVYVYKNGEIVVDSDIVSGSVVKGCHTPSGVYQIFTHDKDRYLNGPGYRSWVNFFCAFNGGIGFHDSSWRSNYGGSIYLYNGSHGCVNMPYSAAKKLYENVSIGTYVVAYGGENKVEKLTQVWKGKEAYTVKLGHKDIDFSNLAKGNPTYTFKSSNEKVATVSKKGIVKIKGEGTCKITITTKATNKYKASKRVITITVLPKKTSLKETSITASLDQTSLTLSPAATATAQVTATTSGDGALSYEVASSNTDLVTATISETGLVTVTAANNTSVTQATTVTITVTIKSAATSTYKEASQTLTLTVTFTPAGA